MEKILAFLWMNKIVADSMIKGTLLGPYFKTQQIHDHIQPTFPKGSHPDNPNLNGKNKHIRLLHQYLDSSTLWSTNSLLWKMAIEIVDCPIENGDFL